MKRRSPLIYLVGGLVILCGCVAASSIFTNRSSSPATNSAPVAASTEVAAEPTAVPTIGATDTPAPTAAPTNTSSPADALTQAAQSVCGANFMDATYNPGAISIVRCKLGDGFSDELIVAGSLMNLADLTTKTMPDPELATLRLVLMGQFKDEYGNLSELPAFAYVMPRALYEKVNWQNILRQDLGKLLQANSDGSDVAVHPAWRENWQAYIAK